ncbi:MAG: hypothetical protein AAF808_07420 [Cyanobacteria bacterium P01_D01_bin.2]
MLILYQVFAVRVDKIVKILVSRADQVDDIPSLQNKSAVVVMGMHELAARRWGLSPR